MPPAASTRDPEIECALVQIDREFADAAARRLSDEVWKVAERLATPNALAFYFELRRLDMLWFQQTQGAPKCSL